MMGLCKGSNNNLFYMLSSFSKTLDVRVSYDKQIEFCNDEFLSMLGYENSDLVNANLSFIFFDEEEKERLQATFDRIIDGRCSVIADFKVKAKDGKAVQTRWIISKVDSEFKTERYLVATGMILEEDAGERDRVMHSLFKLQYSTILAKELSMIRDNEELLREFSKCFKPILRDLHYYEAQEKGYLLSKVSLLSNEESTLPAIYGEFLTGKSSKTYKKNGQDHTRIIVPVFLNETPYCLFDFYIGKTFEDYDVSVMINLLEQIKTVLELNDTIEKFEKEAITDRVTNIWTRQYFMNRLLNEEANLTRYGGVGTVVVIDIGSFRFINERYGHKLADQVLREVAVIVKDSVRIVDYVARYHGDVFVAYFPHTDFENTNLVMERISKRIRMQKFKNIDMSVCIDYGISTYSKDADNMTELLSIADERMYINKRQRKIQELKLT